MAIDVNAATAAGLDALLAIERLKKLHIKRSYGLPEEEAKLPLDHGGEVFVLKADLDGCLRALETLRRKKPGLVVDADEYALHGGVKEERFWQQRAAVVSLRAAWAPASGHPWCAPAAKARCEAWLEERGISISF